MATWHTPPSTGKFVFLLNLFLRKGAGKILLILKQVYIDRLGFSFLQLPGLSDVYGVGFESYPIRHLPLLYHR